jgi:hypothetical protein
MAVNPPLAEGFFPAKSKSHVEPKLLKPFIFKRSMVKVDKIPPAALFRAIRAHKATDLLWKRRLLSHFHQSFQVMNGSAGSGSFPSDGKARAEIRA